MPRDFERSLGKCVQNWKYLWMGAVFGTSTELMFSKIDRVFLVILDFYFSDSILMETHCPMSIGVYPYHEVKMKTSLQLQCFYFLIGKLSE